AGEQAEEQVVLAGGAGEREGLRGPGDPLHGRKRMTSLPRRDRGGVPVVPRAPGPGEGAGGQAVAQPFDGGRAHGGGRLAGRRQQDTAAGLQRDGREIGDGERLPGEGERAPHRCSRLGGGDTRPQDRLRVRPQVARVAQRTWVIGGAPESTAATLRTASMAIPLRVPRVALPTWGRSTTLSSSSRPGSTSGSRS